MLVRPAEELISQVADIRLRTACNNKLKIPGACGDLRFAIARRDLRTVPPWLPVRCSLMDELKHQTISYRTSLKEVKLKIWVRGSDLNRRFGIMRPVS